MQEPPEEMRREFIENWQFTEEGSCLEALRKIEERLHEYVSDQEAEGEIARDAEAEDVLAMVEAWAGLMSYVVLETYGQHSAMRHAGWYADVPLRLRRMCGRLRGPLRWVASNMGALDFSIGVSFPGGVSVSLSWTP
ncbi:hypothetical protein ACIGO6_39980 [Streptomyces sp. NPDC053750]|uniref:hypothetical protein n=1 Tax=Streptomyces sp. NPDC053750 TaxID=3365714 RepID=UPI0037D52BBC